MNVYKSTGATQSKFQNQEFFNNFIWSNFTIGDIVWLEDYRGEVEKIAGVFVGYRNGLEPIIRLLPNRASNILANNNSETILSYPANYWKKFLQ